MVTKKGCQKGCQIGHKHPKLTPKQKDILTILTTTSLTPKQIAQRRGVSRQAIYKIITSLNKKGLLSKRLSISNAPSKPPLKTPYISSGIRLHAEEYNIQLLSKTLKYDIQRTKGNIIYLDNNTIRLYNKSIEVYSGQSFLGKDVREANTKSRAYWLRFWFKLENLLNIQIIKERKANIKLVKSHYSDVHNEIAKECEKSKEKIKIKAQEDNKTAYEIDNSYNLHEFEALHPETSQQDMIKAEKHFQDWRNNNPPTNTEIMGIIAEQTNQIGQLVNYNIIHAENIQSHIKAIQILGQQVKKLNHILDKIAKYK